MGAVVPHGEVWGVGPPTATGLTSRKSAAGHPAGCCLTRGAATAQGAGADPQRPEGQVATM